MALPTVVSEAQEREGLWLFLSPLLPVSSGEPPELDQSGLVRMYFQTELRQSLPELSQESLSIRSVLKAHHKIVSIADDYYVTVCHLLAPDHPLPWDAHR